ncbi:MAG TPA: hypothetical protein VIM01_03210, partial [Dermatophilaceae bacterium]
MTDVELVADAETPVGLDGATVSATDGARNTALATYQSAALPKVNAARCGPAELVLTSSATTELLARAARMTNVAPALDPGVTAPGVPPVIRPENT